MSVRRNFHKKQNNHAMDRMRTPSRRKLPDHIVNHNQYEDLVSSWKLYETEESKNQITMSQARGILWNFGYWRLTKHDFDKILDQNQIDHRKSYIEFNELLNIVTTRYYEGGAQQEIQDSFNMFDRRGRGQITLSELRKTFQEKLQINITETELIDMIEQSGLNPSQALSLQDFEQL